MDLQESATPKYRTLLETTVAEAGCAIDVERDANQRIVSLRVTAPHGWHFAGGAHEIFVHNAPEGEPTRPSYKLYATMMERIRRATFHDCQPTCHFWD